MLLLSLLCTAATTFAYDFEFGDLCYNITGENTVEVTYAYENSKVNYQKLTTATIPATVTNDGTTYSVTSIGNDAFRYSSSLESVTIGKSVTSIGQGAFRYCSSLKSVTIGKSVTSIGWSAFSYCSSLKSVTIGNSVTSIGLGAFEYCSSLTSITLPNSVTSIETHAFEKCSSLTSLTIPNSVTSIGNSAFYGCKSLTSIVVESGNTIYDSRDNCNAIIETATNTLIVGCQSTIIPNSVTSIGNSAFIGCSSLTSITIPNSVTSIGESAFFDCSSLTSITLPNSVTSIRGYTFNGCSSLTSITIPNSVTSIGNLAFQDCSSLADIYCYATTPPKCDNKYTFDRVSKNCNIYVPLGTVRAYQLATGWRDFSYYYEIEVETALSGTEQQNKPSRKILRDGQVLILRNGVAYDMMGQTL